MEDYNPKLGFLVYDIARYMRIAFDKKMGFYGLTGSQWFTLGYLHREDGVSQKKLAELLGIGKVSVCGLINRMEKAGWVKRRADPKDSRIRLVSLTKKSRSMIDEILVLSDTLLKDMVESLSKPSIKELMKSLQTIEKNLIKMNGNQ